MTPRTWSGAHKDRHENIGAGHIGAEPFGELFGPSGDRRRAAGHRDAGRQGGARGGRGPAEGAARGRCPRLLDWYPTGVYGSCDRAGTDTSSLGTSHEAAASRARRARAPARAAFTASGPVSWATAAQGHPALPHRLRHRRGPRHGHRHRAGLAQHPDDDPRDRPGLRLRLRPHAARGARRPAWTCGPRSGSRWPPTPSRSPVMELIDNGVIALWSPARWTRSCRQWLFWAVAGVLARPARSSCHHARSTAG